jgi:hypothetical protein
MFVQGHTGRNDRRRYVAIRSRSEMAGQLRNHDFRTRNCTIRAIPVTNIGICTRMY